MGHYPWSVFAIFIDNDYVVTHVKSYNVSRITFLFHYEYDVHKAEGEFVKPKPKAKKSITPAGLKFKEEECVCASFQR